MRLHFHVIEADFGYLPDSDPETYLAIDDAIEAMVNAANQYMNGMSQLDPDEPIRGQSLATVPVTASNVIDQVSNQIDEIRTVMRTEEDFMTDVANRGIMIVLDDGLRYVEVAPCSDTACEPEVT